MSRTLWWNNESTIISAPYGPVAYDILEAQLNFTRLSSVYLYQVITAIIIAILIPVFSTMAKLFPNNSPPTMIRKPLE